jgi:medium-chain acyl-[acyl-carrier-protein] hydrolase
VTSVPTPWLAGDPAARSDRVRVFCLPYAGGGASAYVPWQRAQDQLEILPVRLPGREARAAEPSIPRMDPLVEQLTEGLRPYAGGSFAIFGHSMGGLVALELARRLTAEGLAPEHLVVGGSGAPGARETWYSEQVPDAQVIEFIRDLGGTPSAIVDDAELMAVILPAIRADLELCATYNRAPGPKLGCPISLLSGRSEDPIDDPYAGWDCLTDTLQVRSFAGGHFFPFAESFREVLDYLLAALARPSNPASPL